MITYLSLVLLVAQFKPCNFFSLIYYTSAVWHQFNDIYIYIFFSPLLLNAVPLNVTATEVPALQWKRRKKKSTTTTTRAHAQEKRKSHKNTMYIFCCRMKAKMFIIKLFRTHIPAAKRRTLFFCSFVYLFVCFRWMNKKRKKKNPRHGVWLCLFTFLPIQSVYAHTTGARCIPRCDFKITSKLFYIFHQQMWPFFSIHSLSLLLSLNRWIDIEQCGDSEHQLDREP